ncbi:ABC transporter permease [Rhodoligotrophos defluvii]|uniref:ABC transporter permease n=1 Tax=Rhodoligotrophos defluvii TaxID=2561934 RepID=UPI0010C9A26E|nr:ABC transporter permease [Rhodoligotrophos defluvii]
MAYPIEPDPALAAEFKKTPLGHHSPALQRLLRIFRTLPVAGKHALLRVDHQRRWVLVQFNGRKGEPLTIHRDHVFTDWNEAEWAVFKLRWKAYFGSDVPEALR